MYDVSVLNELKNITVTSNNVVKAESGHDDLADCLMTVTLLADKYETCDITGNVLSVGYDEMAEKPRRSFWS